MHRRTSVCLSWIRAPGVSVTRASGPLFDKGLHEVGTLRCDAHHLAHMAREECEDFHSIDKTVVVVMDDLVCEASNWELTGAQQLVLRE